MSEQLEITFMQTRLIRLASEDWQMPLERVVELFRTENIFQYIEKGYGIFHCEGDETVLEDIGDFLAGKGIAVNA